MNKFIYAEEAFYDEEKMLWGCYVGFGKEKILRFTVWAATEKNAISQAKLLAERLNGE